MNEEIKKLIQTYEEDLKAGNSTLPTHWIIKDLKKLLKDQEESGWGCQALDEGD